MKERFGGELPPQNPETSREGLPHQIEILCSQLEKGETTHFDGKITSLLKSIEGDETRSALLRSVENKGLSIGSFIGSKIAGIAGGLEAARRGSEHVRNQAQEYLSSRLNLTPEAIKSTSTQAVDSIKERADRVVDKVSEKIPSKVNSEISSFLKDVGNGVQEAKDALMEGRHVKVKQVMDQVSETSNKALEDTVHTVNTHVLKPGIDAASDAVGYSSYIPFAIGGYLAGSALAGGTVGVIKEIRKEGSFAGMKELMEKAWDTSDDSGKEKETACIELLAKFEKISSDPTSYSFTRNEWLMTAGAVRQARIYLLRKKTAPPQIVAGDEWIQKGLIKQKDVVEGIIMRQEGLAETDKDLALEILTQFDKSLEDDMDPIKKRNLRRDQLAPKVMRYSKVFAKEGLNATGLPLLWKTVKIPFRTAAYVAKKVIPFA